MITNKHCNVINENHLPLMELFTVNNNCLPFIKTFTLSKIIYRQ